MKAIFRLFWEEWGRLPSEVGKLTLPQVEMLVGKAGRGQGRKLTPAELKAMGLMR